MVLSNAERQERYRQRLKARATGADLGEQARAAVDAAFAAVWAIFSRPAPDGGEWGDLEGFADLAGWQASFHNFGTAEILAMFEGWLSEDEETEITDAEREAIERGAAIYRAALLKHIPEPEPVKRSRRKKA